MPALLSPRTKTRVLSPLERMLNEEGLLVELDRIMTCDEFDDEWLHDDILAEMPKLDEYKAAQKKSRSMKTSGMPPQIAVLFNNPVLTTEQEQHMFRKYNFLKYQAKKLLDRKTHGFGVQRDTRRLLQEAVVIKKFLADSNMRLAVNVSKKFAYSTQQNHNLWSIVGEANLCIMKSIPCFDFTLKFKFSTYATWGMRNNLGRAHKDECEHQNRFSSGHDLVIFDRPHEEDDSPAARDRQAFLSRVVNNMLEKLDERDREIIRMYMLDQSQPSLDSVGQRFGITKERVRQIKVRSIKKMREMATTGEVSLNGFLQEFVNDGKNTI